MNIHSPQIRFSELLMQFFRYMSSFGFDLMKQIIVFAGVPTFISSFLLTFPARPLDTSTIIVEAGFSWDSHLVPVAGILLFSILSIILTLQISTIHSQYCLKYEEIPSRELITQYLLETMPRSFGACMLLCIAISIGLILCILPGIYIMSAGVLLFPLIHDTDISIFSGLQLSVTYIRHHALKPLAFMLLISFITSIPSTALGFLTEIPIPVLDSFMPRIIFMLNALISILTLGMISVFGVILHKELLKGTDFAIPIAPIK